MPKMQGGLNANAAALKSFIKNSDGIVTSVGFLGNQVYPDGRQVGSVAAENEFGRVEKQQPPRPFMRPAILELESEAPNVVADMVKMAMDDSSFSPVEIFENLGMYSAIKIIDKIEEVNEPALSPTTIKKRRERGNTSTKPLEDTLTMKNAVDFRVDKK